LINFWIFYFFLFTISKNPFLGKKILSILGFLGVTSKKGIKIPFSGDTSKNTS
jgi:hypothetical protein